MLGKVVNQVVNGNGSVTEVSTQSFMSRLMGSVMGVLFGLAMFFGSFALLWWNEGDIVAEKAAFEEMTKNAVNANAKAPVKKHDGKLVHATGKLDAKEKIGDAPYLKAGDYLSLERQVEMYQWVQTEHKEKKKNGGSEKTVTTYEYDMKWAVGREDSDSFKNPKGHANPPLSIEPTKAQVTKVTFGKYDGSEVLERVSSKDLPVTAAMLAATKAKPELKGGKIYQRVKAGAKADALGDVRISYKAVKPDTFSVMARQSGTTELATYVAKNGKEKFLVTPGKKSARQMITTAKDDAKTFAMVMRFVGFFIMWLGMCMMVAPLTLMLDAVPFIGSFLGSAGKFVLYGSFLVIAAILSTVTIVVAMVAHHPVALAVVMIAVAGSGFYFYSQKKKAPLVGRDGGHGQQPPQRSAA